jgi:histidyl-tRNA synthetase
MINLFKWHINFTVKKRIAYGLSYYQGYWFSWYKALVFGVFIMWMLT